MYFLLSQLTHCYPFESQSLLNLTKQTSFNSTFCNQISLSHPLASNKQLFCLSPILLYQICVLNYKSGHIKFLLITITRRHKLTGWHAVNKSRFLFLTLLNKQTFSSRPTSLHKIRNHLFKLVHTDSSVTKTRLITLIIYHK